MEARKPVILLVDEEKIDAQAHASVLKAAGYETLFAYSGEGALEMIVPGQIHVDLILLDLKRGNDLNGAETAKKILDLRDIPIIFLSSHTEKEIVEQISDIPAYGYIIKNTGDAVLLSSVAMARKLHETKETLKQSEALLKAREEFLDSIIENIPSMVFAKEAESLRFVKINKTAEDVMGFRREDLLGKNDYDIFTKEQADFFRETDLSVLSKKEITDIPEEIIRTRDRGNIFLHTKKIPVFDNRDKPLFLVGISEDITESKRAREELIRSEARFRSYFDLPLAGLAITSIEGSWLDVNGKLCDMLGYSKEELLLKTWADVTHPDDLPTDLDHYNKLLSGETQSYSMDKRYIRKDGSHIWVTIAVGKVLDSAGGTDFIVTIIQDISDRKKLENSLSDSVKQRELLLKELQHRVKNTLSIVSGILQIEKDRLKDGEAGQAFMNAQTRIDSISEAYKNLYQSEDLEYIDLSSYIGGLAKSIFASYAADIKGLTCRLDLKPSKLDLKRAVTLGLIINELITNAVKYAYPAGEGEVRIALDGDGKTLEVIVSDDGVGLPKGFTVNEAKSMGLLLVQMLTEQLEGTVETAPGPGTSVRLRFYL